jgi:lipopolysaccharide cholinephosphotransferase
MPREDYEKFLDLQSSLPDDLFIQHFKTDSEYLLYYAKVRKNDTIFLEERDKYQGMHCGISLDVFPLDAISTSDDRGNQYKQLQRRFARANRNYGGISGKLKSFLYRLVYPKAEESFAVMDKQIQRHNTEGAVRECKYIGPPHANWYFEREELYPIKAMPFENIFIAVPNKVERYLEKKYGDYMKIPEESERVAHEPIKVQIGSEIF